MPRPMQSIETPTAATHKCSIDRLQPHHAHQTTSPATADAHDPVAQMTSHRTDVVELMLQQQLIDVSQQRQGLLAFALASVYRASIARLAANDIDVSRSAPDERTSQSLSPTHRPHPLKKNPAPQSTRLAWRDARGPRFHDPNASARCCSQTPRQAF